MISNSAIGLLILPLLLSPRLSIAAVQSSVLPGSRLPRHSSFIRNFDPLVFAPLHTIIRDGSAFTEDRRSASSLRQVSLESPS